MVEEKGQMKSADAPNSRPDEAGQANDQYQPLPDPQAYTALAPPPYPGPSAQSTIQYQPAAQIVYIQIAPPGTRVYQHYNGKLSMAFGIVNIVLVTTSIILNVFAFNSKIAREYGWLENTIIIMCPTAFCGFFIYLAAAFSIASGVRKTRCLVITHLVLVIIGSVFAFTFLGLSLGALATEITSSVPDTLSLATSIVWTVFSVIMFITSVWCSTLCCRVICCGASTEPMTGTVVYPMAAREGM